MRIWSKRISPRLEEQWRARLAWLEDEKVVVTLNPASPGALNLQVFDLNAQEAARLLAEHGGKIQELCQEDWLNADQGAQKPLKVRDLLLVANSAKARDQAALEYPGRPLIYIPPGMAFGTGDHATTLTALRRLAEAATRLRKNAAGWTCCDAGSGTGVLAIAAEKLGARVVHAFDFDETAVEITRENAAANNCRLVEARRQDVLEWQPQEPYDVLLANIYGDILVPAMPTLKRALRPGAAGTLILSGILRTQAPAVFSAADQAGLTQLSITQVGKWVTTVYTSP